MNYLDAIKDIFRCKFCFNTYDKPIITPCGKLLCEKDMEKFFSTKKCFYCGTKHDIKAVTPIVDDRISKLIQLNLHEFNYGKTHNEALVACKNLEKNLSLHYELKSNPNSYIERYFVRLEKEIAMKESQFISQIRNSHDQILSEIKHFKNECLENAKKEREQFILSFSLDESYEKLKEWYKFLFIPNFDNEPAWKEVKQEAEMESIKLEKKLKDLRNELLIDREFFIESLIEPVNVSIGVLDCKSTEKTDGNREHGTITFEMNDFILFTKCYEMRYDLNCYIFKNISWRICSKIEQTLDFNLSLGFYLKCEIADIERKEHDIEVEAVFRLKRVRDTSLINRVNEFKFVHTFKSNEVFGFKNFVLLKTIMDPITGFYDCEKDLIALEIDMLSVLEKF